ncbi:MAG TPA: TetR/AcrR family transcriptional regulator [Solirubrobacteraceae bacterium]
MDEVKRRSRAEKQAQTRTELIEAATRVFAHRGYQVATVEEIAETAGYSHGAVYSNFAGKEELFLAVFERYMAQRVQEVASATETEGSFVERSRAAADQWMQRFTEDRATFLLHLEFMIHAARNPHLSKQLGERMSALRLEIERYLTEREETAQTPLPLPAADLALILRALGIGLAVEALNAPGAIDTHLYGDFVALMAGLLEANDPDRAATGQPSAAARSLSKDVRGM